MRLLSVAGTAAMFLVGGGILTHGIPAVHHFIEATAASWGGVAGAVAPTLLTASLASSPVPSCWRCGAGRQSRKGAANA